tara:strand:- start:184 stop:912 length:729 start_codon:yes stop_codon:yes gene_type:complete
MSAMDTTTASQEDRGFDADMEEHNKSEAAKVAPTPPGTSNVAAAVRAKEANLAAKKNPQPAANKNLMHPPSVTPQQSSSGISVAFGALGKSTTPPPGPLRSVFELVRSASALFGGAESEKAAKAAESTSPRLQPAGTPSRLPAKKSEGANVSEDDGVLWKNKMPAADAADSDDVGSTPAVRARASTPPALDMSLSPRANARCTGCQAQRIYRASRTLDTPVPLPVLARSRLDSVPMHRHSCR